MTMSTKSGEAELDCSVVVPVFNSSESLSELSRRAGEALSDYCGANQFEVVFVDDGSPSDKTWPAIQVVVARDEHAKGVQLTRNFGRACAVLAGMEVSRGRHIVVMDDDLQHRPEDIPRLLDVSWHDIVFAQFPHRKHSAWVKLSSRLKGWFDRILIGKPKGVTVSPFLCVKREIVDAMREIRTPYPFIPALLFFVTRDVGTVEVTHERRMHGKPAFTLGKRIRQFSALLINNSSFLLQVMAVLGVGLAAASALYAGWIVTRALTGDIDVAGWSSIMVAVLFTSGMILLSLGIIGEYLIRIVSNTELRPPYFVRNVIDDVSEELAGTRRK